MKISEYIWGYDEDQIEDAVVNGLLKKGKKLAVIELFTGGLIADKLSNNSKFSQILTEVIVAGNSDLLNRRFGISKNISEVMGQFTSEWIMEVANKARKAFNADYVLATSKFKVITGEENREQNGYLNAGCASETSINYREIRLSKDYIFNKNRAAHLTLDFLRQQL